MTKTLKKTKETFKPLSPLDVFYVERLCKCATETKCRCDKSWRRIRDQNALNQVLAYLNRYRPEIFEVGTINDDFAFYRVVRN